MDYLNKLNEKQREAATCVEGPLLIMAGAGSGKTSTMTHRIAYMIREKGIRPYHILAVTFTNKAAREMKERIESLVGEGLPIWVMTFHSACLRILRVHGELLGYDRDFVVYDPTDQKTVIKACMREAAADEKFVSVPAVLSIISSCKEKGISPKEYIDLNGDDFRQKTIGELYGLYEKKLKKNNAMDFDDLLLNTVRLFERDEAVLMRYQERFRYIMVDEYQDTNTIQYRFIRMLAEAHNNICAVGDDDQCIYQWRGADIRNILEFEKDFRGVRIIKLEQNYRSTGNILAAAHSVVEKNRERKAKKLWTTREAGEKIVYYRADDEKDEARYVAREIDRLRDSGREWRDFAVLYRNNAQSRTFEEALMGRDIPYRVLGGIRYYDRKEIKDMTAYMRLVQNPADDVSLRRVLNEPKRGIGDKTLEKLEALAALKGTGILELLGDSDVLDGLPSKSRDSVRELAETLAEAHRERDTIRVSALYDLLLDKTGYLAALERQDTIEAESRIENLMEFKSVIHDFEKGEQDLNLAGFMERLALMSDVDNHDEEENAAVLMTMHSAKGLEFPVVFLPGMEDGLFPGWRAMDTARGLEEERRLCYVGMTRAKERLYLTGARMRTLYGRTDYTKESRFLQEVDRRLLAGDSVWEPSEKKPPWAPADGDGYKSAGVYRPFSPAAGGGNRSGGENPPPEVFGKGDRVRHRKFGEGTVTAADGRTMTVDFGEQGVKKLLIEMAPVTRL